MNPTTIIIALLVVIVLILFKILERAPKPFEYKPPEPGPKIGRATGVDDPEWVALWGDGPDEDGVYFEDRLRMIEEEREKERQIRDRSQSVRTFVKGVLGAYAGQASVGGLSASQLADIWNSVNPDHRVGAAWIARRLREWADSDALPPSISQGKGDTRADRLWSIDLEALRSWSESNAEHDC